MYKFPDGALEAFSASSRATQHKQHETNVISRFDAFQLGSSVLSAARVAAPPAPAAQQQRVESAVASVKYLDSRLSDSVSALRGI